MPALGEYLRAGGARDRVPGVWDCCTLPCDWLVACGTPDPMAEYRGAYATEAEAQEIIARAGSLVALFDRGMRSAGVSRVRGWKYQPGDVAVVELLGEQAGAIYTGERWALVADRGLAFVAFTRKHIKRAWRA